MERGMCLGREEPRADRSWENNSLIGIRVPALKPAARMKNLVSLACLRTGEYLRLPRVRLTTRQAAKGISPGAI